MAYGLPAHLCRLLGTLDMFNLAITSTVIAGASLLTLSTRTSTLFVPATHSECGSLVLFGIGLFALSVFVRRAGTR